MRSKIRIELRNRESKQARAIVPPRPMPALIGPEVPRAKTAGSRHVIGSLDMKNNILRKSTVTMLSNTAWLD